MQADFELAVAHLLPECPVAAKVSDKLKNAQISGLGGNLKAGTVPNTGVELRYHKPPEFAQLRDAQRDKLFEIHPPKKGKGNKESHHKKGDMGGRLNSHGRNKTWGNKIKGQVAAAIRRLKEEDKE